MITALLLTLAVSGVVPDVNLERYAGTWHEIARLPNRFQAKCVGDVTADYKLRADGKIDVLNRCRIKDGTFIEARGLARVAGKGQPNSVLKVRFAPAFLSFLPQVWGDYQIRALAPDYSYSVVGSPDFKYLWILARTPELPASTYDQLIQAMRKQGYAVDRLVKSSSAGISGLSPNAIRDSAKR
jgi:apolipoprotein D and lipocalin family protein